MKKLIAFLCCLMVTSNVWGQTEVIRRGQTEAEKQEQLAKQRQKDAQRAANARREREEAEWRAEEERLARERALRQKAINDSLERVRKEKEALEAERNVTLEVKAAGGTGAHLDYQADGLKFEVWDKGEKVKLSKVKGKGKVVVPAKITYLYHDGHYRAYETVNVIGDYAFGGSQESITSIVLPNTITTIEDVAFASCINLEGINIPRAVKEIGYGVFNNCRKLKTITIDEGNESFVYEDGILYNKDKSELICALPGVVRDDIIIPNSVRHIQKQAFRGCDSIKSVTLPEGLINLSSYVFQG